MNKFSNSAMLLDIENFMKQQIADKIKTCPSRIKIHSIGCIYQQRSQPVDENGFAIDEDDDDEEDAKNLFAELTDLSEVNLRDAQKYLL